MGFDDQSYSAKHREAPARDNEDPAKRARREEKERQKDLERKTKVGGGGGHNKDKACENLMIDLFLADCVFACRVHTSISNAKLR